MWLFLFYYTFKMLWNNHWYINIIGWKDSDGVLHLKKWSDVGLTHIHLLSMFQFANEKDKWKFVSKRSSSFPLIFYFSHLQCSHNFWWWWQCWTCHLEVLGIHAILPSAESLCGCDVKIRYGDAQITATGFSWTTGIRHGRSRWRRI